MNTNTQQLHDAIKDTLYVLEEAAKHAWRASEAAHAAYVLAARTAPTAAQRADARAHKYRVEAMRAVVLAALAAARTFEGVDQ